MLSRREALLGVMLAPLVKPVVAMLPKGDLLREEPWVPKWKETIFYSGGNAMGIEPKYQVGETMMIGGEVWWVISVTRVRDRFVSDGLHILMPLDQVLIRARNV